MSGNALGKLEQVDPRFLWTSEPTHFTPWFASNLPTLGEALGLELEFIEAERSVGPFACDIEARDINTGRKVMIENQPEPTDHTHLGQLLTYAAGLDASAVIHKDLEPTLGGCVGKMKENYVTKPIKSATGSTLKCEERKRLVVLIIIQLLLSGCTSEPVVSTISQVNNNKNNHTQSIFLKGRIYSSPFRSYLTLRSGKIVCHSINREERIEIGKKFSIKCSNGMIGEGIITSRSGNSGGGVLYMSNGFDGGFVFGQKIYRPVKM